MGVGWRGKEGGRGGGGGGGGWGVGLAMDTARANGVAPDEQVHAIAKSPQSVGNQRCRGEMAVAAVPCDAVEVYEIHPLCRPLQHH